MTKMRHKKSIQDTSIISAIALLQLRDNVINLTPEWS